MVSRKDNLFFFSLFTILIFFFFSYFLYEVSNQIKDAIFGPDFFPEIVGLIFTLKSFRIAR
jgi:hypothetical protein